MQFEVCCCHFVDSLNGLWDLSLAGVTDLRHGPPVPAYHSDFEAAIANEAGTVGTTEEEKIKVRGKKELEACVVREVLLYLYAEPKLPPRTFHPMATSILTATDTHSLVASTAFAPT